MKNKGNALIVLLLIAASFFAGYYYFKSKHLEQGQALGTKQQQTSTPSAPPAAPKELKIKQPSPSEHWKGTNIVRYVWVEYSDFECPFCKRIQPDLEKLSQVYSGKIAWVYRQYPLPFHPKAQKSAEASECAASLGGNDAFWKMQNAIFEKMPELELTQLPDLAAANGLDKTKFKSCLDSGDMAKTVKDQANEGTNAGIQATPTNVIYDLKTGKTSEIEGALPYEQLRLSLDAFIAQAK